MKLIRNGGGDRVIDEWKKHSSECTHLDIASTYFSLYAFEEVRETLPAFSEVRLALSKASVQQLQLLGGVNDRGSRNRLTSRWLASQCAAWLERRAQVRFAGAPMPQAALAFRGGDQVAQQIVTGACSFTTDGLGITAGDQFALIQGTESADECRQLSLWFDALWSSLPAGETAKNELAQLLRNIAKHHEPALIYYLTLHSLFRDSGDGLDEERIIKSATGIRNKAIWKKLFKFQRDGVVGAIDKLERFGGCIIADSVGLGKTFEALAIIKYYELRNDRVLVLAPKRLRDNWTLYKVNDRRNILAGDRFNYDVLNHTDLSRDEGMSGDIDLSYVNWGNYDLVVIDESHNFRNKITYQGRESRYARLMRKIIREGVKTRVLMLSATPVNNRLTDLKNQIAFVTEGDDAALSDQGISSIEETVRKAQLQFNRWLRLEETEREPARLMDMLGFDYFKLLDALTIARSRKHVEKYYGTTETGRFPERMKPENIKADVDRARHFPAIREVNNQIRRLNLAAYAPLKYLLPHKQAEYDAKYSTKIRGGESIFRQADREESLINLLRVNILKRMESSVNSFALTLTRQLRDVSALLSRIEAHAEEVEEVSIDDIEVDDPAFETLLVGRAIKVLLQDIDLVRWKQDLVEDRNRLETLLSAARDVDAVRDDKLERLKQLIAHKVRSPINPGNRKVLVFTAFADTAEYLYRELSVWGARELKLHAALVTGAGSNRTTLDGLRTDLVSVLTAFAPKAKERPEDMSGEGELDLLIATDCISEGQNLQDCDFLVNYDIHWNPVRIIQRFGRIDRIGSTNARIQLVNFWPNMELEEYINLEQRVSGKMVLLDVSATGEENLIEQQAGNQMNDLEYRRKQLLKLQDAVIDLEDLSSGVSIADLTLNDFRVDLAEFVRDHPLALETAPLGVMAVTAAQVGGEVDIPPGIIFCLRAEGNAVAELVEPGYPLSPYFLVHISEDGELLLPYTQAKQVLDRLRKLCVGRELPDAAACGRFDKATRNGQDMRRAQESLAKAIASIAGKTEERAIASLFVPGGTHARKGEFAGMNDFEVVAFLVVLPGAE